VTGAIPSPKGLLFDMDGTLTRPMLDFEAIRDEIGIRGPILEAIRHFSDIERARAGAILDRHERHAAEQSELNEGCVELLEWTTARGWPRAIVTRNSQSSVEIVIRKHGLSFDAVVHRENAPHKPDPRALHVACTMLKLTCRDVWMVGDGSHDIEAGRAAGVPTVWISHGQARPFTAEPTCTFESLVDLLKLLQASHRL
jgi:HAD superfamily hydrolase (TIGR01549 family)